MYDEYLLLALTESTWSKVIAEEIPVESSNWVVRPHAWQFHRHFLRNTS